MRNSFHSKCYSNSTFISAIFILIGIVIYEQKTMHMQWKANQIPTLLVIYLSQIVISEFNNIFNLE